MRLSILASTLAGFALAGPSLAHAGDAPSGASQDPPRFVDEAYLSLDLMNQSGGYRPRLITYVYGVTGAQDAVRLDWLVKGKVVGSERCKIKPTQVGLGELPAGQVECKYSGKPFTETKDVSARLYYLDDQAEAEYLLRTFKPRIGAFTFIKQTKYQVMPDDALGVAYAWHGDDPSDTRYMNRLAFYFWIAKDPGRTEVALRCTVDGAKQPDLEGYLENGKTMIEVEDDTSGERRDYAWTQAVLRTPTLHWGTRAQVAERKRYDPSGSFHALGDQPGAWSCDLRADGKVLRTLKFQVGADGRIAPHPAQTAPGAPMLLPSIAMLDVRLPARNEWDVRVRGSAIKASMPWGLPWPKHDSLKEMLDAAPADSGLPDPGKAGKAGKKK